jgi:hypothetical protein
MPANKYRHHITTPKEEAMKRASPIKDQIIALYKAGLSNTEICISMGKEPGNVSNALSEARRAGLISGYNPRIKNPMTISVAKHVSRRAKDKGKKVGSFKEIIGTLPKEIANWLIKQTPDGESLALTITAIITDAYHDENN